MMAGIIEQLLLGAILAAAGIALVLTVQSRRRTASRLQMLSDTLATLVKANYHHSRQSRDNGELLKKVHLTGLENLASQRKAHDHQRVLMASLSRQAASISQMLGAPETTGELASAQEQRTAAPQSPKLPRRAGFRMAPVVGSGSPKRMGTVPLASLLDSPVRSENMTGIPDLKSAGVVALEQLFDESTGSPQASVVPDGAELKSDDRSVAATPEESDMNRIPVQRVANG